MNTVRPRIKTRISPTPSGFLHLGNALNFVYIWLMARSHGAHITLRIDDLDADRVRPEYIEDIFRTLDWLGIDYDEGPSGPDELKRSYSQRLRLDRYQETLESLKEELFVCTCTRKQIMQESMDGQYPGTCRDLELDTKLLEAFSMRIRIPEPCFVSWNDLKQGPQRVNLYANMRDFVLVRKDGIPAYQLASLTDDLDMEINLIVRGEDLRDSTAAQLYLAGVLGQTSFLQTEFLHHPLLRDPRGEKLSKSAGALSIQELRKLSSKPGDVLTQIAHMLGCPHTIQVQTIQELLSQINHLSLLEAIKV